MHIKLKNRLPVRLSGFLDGGDGEDRTPDLTDANRTLSQLSYAPKQFPMRCRIGSIVSLSYLLWFVKW